MDELLAGQWLSARVCPHCDHPPDDFVDGEGNETEVARVFRTMICCLHAGKEAAT